MKKSVLVLLLLSACSSSQEHPFAAACYSRGFEKGTDEFIACINEEHAQFVRIQSEYR